MNRIRIISLALVLVPAALHADQARADLIGGDGLAALAPEAWSQQDPADSLYRTAREAMNQGEPNRAATLFHRIWNQFPKSTYAPDAPYWEAFNRYRTSETDALQQALEALAMQRERFAKAPTRTNGDAQALETRILGILARRGDEQSAATVVAAANRVAGVVNDPEFQARMAELGERMAEHSRVLADEIGGAMSGVAEEVASAMGGVHIRAGDDIPEQCREQVEVQMSALNALLHMNADRAMPVLKKIMARRDECAPPLRRRAVFLIAEQQTPTSVDMLLDAAKNDPDVEVQRQAVFWLSEVDDDRAVDALAQFVKSSADAETRERAVFALSQHSSPRARQVLRSVTQDASMSESVRSKAIFWLGSEGNADDVQFLKGLFGKLQSRELQERVIMAVAQGDHPDGAWLLALGSNPNVDSELRSKAIFWAAEAGVSAEDLGALYGRLETRELKERVLFALSESDQPAAIDRLIRIARTEKDPELRKKALFWLGNSNDPRAADVLMEILSGPGGQ